ncbi:hypothetical protein C1645_874781 [Glomus cerebriforme]|uniref:Uncharacterized protein n=1 Tax=Glomus cerebriforme TaxID=658196 RepID=A0A397T2Q5_9GLOM|nr:hypothetical protein C1645_874781 [Glomus cerebriforme]
MYFTSQSNKSSDATTFNQIFLVFALLIVLAGQVSAHVHPSDGVNKRKVSSSFPPIRVRPGDENSGFNKRKASSDFPPIRVRPGDENSANPDFPPIRVRPGDENSGFNKRKASSDFPPIRVRPGDENSGFNKRKVSGLPNKRALHN